MEEYAKYIDNLAANNESMTFFNSGPQHAGIVMSTIFKYSKNELRMFVGNFNGGVSSQPMYLKQLKRFLERGGKVKILIQDYEFGNNPQLFGLLKSHQFFSPESVILKKSPTKLYKGGETEKEVHVTIGDDRIFRLEDDVETCAARGSFNNPEYCKRLIEIFDKIFDSVPSSISVLN